MAGSTFQTFKRTLLNLYTLLNDCHRGVLQLPDFQRSWVWDEERIKQKCRRPRPPEQMTRPMGRLLRPTTSISRRSTKPSAAILLLIRCNPSSI
jgi:hypothetical protein